MDKKLIGSFYTPEVIADFVVDYLSSKLKGMNLTVLEPSAGDGIFIKSMLNHESLSGKIKEVLAVEREITEIDKIKNITDNDALKTINKDFLEFQKDNIKKFSLVIGNPPYIKKKLLEERQISLCEDIHAVFPSLSKNKIKNIWTAFLVRSISFVDKSGVLALVLPSELLQVKFASELRALLITEFERVEIFTFKELLFEDCKGQDTIILIAERKSEEKGVFYCSIDKLIELEKREFSLNQNASIKETKWSHHHLSSDEFVLLETLKTNLKKINYYCSSKAGIVTAANSYFIVDSSKVKEYSLEKYVKPIIQKGLFVNGSVVLNSEDFQLLVSESKPSYLISLDKSIEIGENDRINTYFQNGLDLDINKRYKTSIREKWYEVPNIGIPAEGFFFKRCNEYPKLIKNEANVLVTDSAYKIEMNKDYNINSLIYSFYNSLTLAFAELDGRYYGGGVLELTPNEFKNLPLPYVDINNIKFESFVKEFENKKSIKDILRLNDVKILKSIDKGLNMDTINKLFQIRNKLFLRRIKAD